MTSPARFPSVFSFVRATRERSGSGEPILRHQLCRLQWHRRQCRSHGVVTYLKIPDGNGVFAQRPMKIADIRDGLSNTAAFSESTLGDEVGLRSANQRRSDCHQRSRGGRRQRPDSRRLRCRQWRLESSPRRAVDQRPLWQHALQPLLHAESARKMGLRQRQPQQSAVDCPELSHRRRRMSCCATAACISSSDNISLGTWRSWPPEMAAKWSGILNNPNHCLRRCRFFQSPARGKQVI